MARLGLALGLDAQQFRGEVEGGALGGLPRLFPAAGADTAELRLRLGQPDVAADEMGFLQRHVERDLVVELQRDDLADAVARLEPREAAVLRDAVLEVDHEVAFNQLGEIQQLIHGGGGGDRALGDGAPGALTAEDLGLGNDDAAPGFFCGSELARDGGR